MARDVEVTYDRDDKGRVVRAGARWSETRPFLENFLLKLAVPSLAALLIGFLYPPILGLALLGFMACVGMLLFLPPPMRAVFFVNDGRMLTPHGIFYRPMLQQIGGHHDDIVSIEARMQREQPSGEVKGPTMFEVIILSKGGDLVIVSRNTHENFAIKAAAQLNHTLAAIRKEHADASVTAHEGAWVTLN